MNFVADLIYILHLTFVVYVLFGWISNDINSLVLYIVTLLSLKVHWYANDDTCSLTLLEQSIRGVSKQDSFINRIVSPVYKISDEDTSRFCHALVNIFLLVALFKLDQKPDKNKIFQIIFKKFL